jgi:hypothetical protein
VDLAVNRRNDRSFVESPRGGPPRTPPTEGRPPRFGRGMGGRVDGPRSERRAFLAVGWSLGLGALGLAGPGGGPGNDAAGDPGRAVPAHRGRWSQVHPRACSA